MSLTGTKLVGDNPERGRVENDYYATPFNATEALLNALNESGETLSSDTILEPSAGEGHIVKVLKDFYPYNEIVANDIAYRGSRLGIDVNGGIDFLNYEPHRKFDTIITNPPFALAQEFIEKALTLTNRRVIMFAKIQLLEGDKRRKMFDNSPHGSLVKIITQNSTARGYKVHKVLLSDMSNTDLMQRLYPMIRDYEEEREWWDETSL